MTFPDQPPAPQGDQPEQPQPERPQPPRYGQYAPGYVPAPLGEPAAGPSAPQGPPVAPPVQQGPPSYGQWPPGQYPPAQGQYPPAPGQYPPPPGQYGQPRYGQPGPQQPWGPPAAGSGYGGMPGAPLSLRPGIIPLRPLRIGDFFDGAFRAIRHNPKVMLGIPAILAVLLSLGQTAYYWVYLSAFGSLTSSVAWDTTGSSWYDDSSYGGPSDSTVLLAVVAVGLAALLVGFLGVVCNGVIIASVGQSAIGRVAPLSEVWASVRGRRFGGLLVLGLITGGAAVVGEVVVIGLVVAASFVAVGLAVLVGVVLGIGYLVAVCWFTVRMIIVAPAYVLERTTIRTALRRGWRLTRGSFWRIVGIVALTGVTVYLLSGILGIPSGILMFVAVSSSPAVAVVTTAISVVLGTVVETLVLAFAGAMVALIYIDLRIRREALDATLAAAASDVAAGKTARPGPASPNGLL